MSCGLSLLSFVLQSISTANPPPLFRLRTNQDVAAQALLAHLNDKTVPAQTIVGDIQTLLFTLLTHRFDHDEPFHAAVVCFLLCSMIRPHGIQWIAGKDASSITNRLSYVLRCAVYEHVLQEAHQGGPSAFQVAETLQMWVKTGPDHVFSWIRR
jgi:hypothetical protein